MSVLNRFYWKWSEKYNNSEINLRDSISRLVEDDILEKTDDENKYIVLIDSDIFIVLGNNDKVIALILSRDVKKFITDSNKLWHLDQDNFIKKVDCLMERTDESYSGDKLTVVFRDRYMTFSAITANKK